LKRQNRQVQKFRDQGTPDEPDESILVTARAFIRLRKPWVSECPANDDDSREAADKRLAFLKNLPGNDEYRDKYFSVALNDQSPDVREFAAHELKGTLTPYVACLIEVMATDPDTNVRIAASDPLTHWLTDGGVETCQDAAIVEGHLDQLLEVLKYTSVEDQPLVTNTLDILVMRYSGDLPLLCCMVLYERCEQKQSEDGGGNPRGSQRAEAAFELSGAVTHS